MSFVDSIVSDSQKVFLVTGKEEGSSAWYYVEVEKKKLPYYQKAIKKGSLDLRDYGIIIDSGWGDTPPQGIIDDMEEKYG